MSRFILLVPLLLPALAFADPPASLAVQVTDRSGAPIRTAVVVFDAEARMRHHVDYQTGSWEGSSLYPQGATPHPFAKDESVQFRVGAPGYAVTERKVTLDHRENAVKVVLAPLRKPQLGCLPAKMTLDGTKPAVLADYARMTLDTQDLSSDQDHCLRSLRALALERAWKEAAVLADTQPSTEHRTAELQARMAANDAAALWMSAAPGDATAAALCQESAGWLKPCS